MGDLETRLLDVKKLKSKPIIKNKILTNKAITFLSTLNSPFAKRKNAKHHNSDDLTPKN